MTFLPACNGSMEFHGILLCLEIGRGRLHVMTFLSACQERFGRILGLQFAERGVELPAYVNDDLKED